MKKLAVFQISIDSPPSSAGQIGIKTLYKAIEKSNIPYHFIKFNKPQKGCINLLYHTTTQNLPHTYCFKASHIPDYMSFDRCGYAGWSELANSPLFEGESIDPQRAERFVNNFNRFYFMKNKSKYAQPPISPNFNLNKDYIFMPLQVPSDSVVKLAYLDTFSVIKKTAAVVSHNALDLIIKPHPIADKKYNQMISKFAENCGAIISNNSINDLIDKSKGVLCCNSGVGFESLFYRKHIFTYGKCDYHWVTHPITDLNQIEEIPSKLNETLDTDKINKFLYYYLTKYCIRNNNLEKMIVLVKEIWNKGQE